MPTSSFRQLEAVCRALGLEKKKKKKGVVYFGISPLNHQLVTLVIHIHAKGRDVADGLMMDYVKRLGFKSFEQFNRYYKENC